MGSAQNDDRRLNEGSVRNGSFLQRAGNLLLHNVGKQYIATRSLMVCNNVCFFPVVLVWHVLAGPFILRQLRLNIHLLVPSVSIVSLLDCSRGQYGVGTASQYFANNHADMPYQPHAGKKHTGRFPNARYSYPANQLLCPACTRTTTR